MMRAPDEYLLRRRLMQDDGGESVRIALTEMMAAAAVLDFGGFPFELPSIDDIRRMPTPSPRTFG